MSGTRGRPVGWRKTVPLQRPHRSLKAFDDEWQLIKQFMLLVRKDTEKAKKLIETLDS